MNQKIIIDNPILFGGCGSSGTSLLSYLVNLHSKICCGPEMHILTKKYLYSETEFQKAKDKILKQLKKRELRKYDVLARLWAEKTKIPTISTVNNTLLGASTHIHKRRGLAFIYQPEAYGFSNSEWAAIIQDSNSLKEAVDNFFSIYLAKEGKKRWAEKTPWNCYCIQEFLDTYPSGTYVHIIRDGRDVVPSLIRRGLRPENAVRRWLHDTATIIPFMEDKRCYIIKYEDLVANSKEVLDSFFKYIDESEEADEILYLHGSKPSVNEHNSWNVTTTEPISTKSAGKWKTKSYLDKEYIEQLFRYTELSKETREIFKLKSNVNANDLLHFFGYDPFDNWNSDPSAGLKLTKYFLLELMHKSISTERTCCEIVL